MITLKDLIGRPMAIPIEHEANLETLMDRLNLLEKAYGHPLIVSSGYRTLEHHLEIYRLKGIADPNKIPMQSRHLSGQAADLVPVEDDIMHLKLWIDANLPLMKEIGLWFEAFAYTPTWVHVQTIPPKSGQRFFKP